MISRFIVLFVLLTVWGNCTAKTPIHYTLTQTTVTQDTKEYQFRLSDYHLSNQTTSQKNTLVVLLSTQCTDCLHYIKNLQILQKKYKDSLFILYLFIDDTKSEPTLIQFLKDEKISYFNLTKSSNHFSRTLIKTLSIYKDLPLPMSILYQKTNYVQHYKGIIPIEILEHTIH